MHPGTALFSFLHIFFSVFVFSSGAAKGPERLDLHCPVCAREFSAETPSLDDLADLAIGAGGFFIPEPLYQCPQCRFVSPGEMFTADGDQGEYAAPFFAAAVAYAASDEYRVLVDAAPPCYLFARIVEKAFADPAAATLLGEDVFPDAAPYVAGMYYAMSSLQAEGTTWFGATFASDPDYARRGLEDSVRCLERVVGHRDHPEATLMADYVHADALRRLGEFGQAAERLAAFRAGYREAIEERRTWHYDRELLPALDRLSDRQDELIARKDAATLVRPLEYIENPAFVFFP